MLKISDARKQADILAALSLRRHTVSPSVTCASARPDNGCVVPGQTRAGCAAQHGAPRGLENLSLLDLGDVARRVAGGRCRSGARRSGRRPSWTQVAPGGGDLARRRKARFHPASSSTKACCRVTAPGAAEPPRRGGAQNVTASPSLTAVSHIEIATGSTAVHNDIPSNTFQAIVGPISSSVSGFAASIGGYQESPLGPSPRRRRCRCGCNCASRAGRWSLRRGRAATAPTSRSTARWCNRPSRPASPTTRCRSARSAVSAPRASRVPGGLRRRSGDGHRPPGGRPLLVQPGAGDVRTDRDVLVRLRADRDLHQCGDAGRQIRDPGGGARHHQRPQGELRHPGVLRHDARHYGWTVPPPSTGPAYARFGGENAPFFFDGSGAKVGAAYFVSRWRPISRSCASPVTAPTSFRATHRC